MFKKVLFSSIICLSLVFSMQENSFAQEKTEDELKAEREVLKSEMKSKQAEERKEKFEKLRAPGTSGITTIDQLMSSSTQILASTKYINAVLPDVYKRTIGETIDGITDITVKKPQLDELLELATSIALQIQAVAQASTAVAKAPEELKKASPMNAPKGLKSINYTKDVLTITGPELELSSKIVNNLIATIKSANNN